MAGGLPLPISQLPSVSPPLTGKEIIPATVNGNTSKLLSSYMMNGGVLVEAFGAVGDGTTDDTAAIQNAINACAGKYTLVFDKQYKVTSTLTLTTKSTLQGLAGSSITFSGSMAANSTLYASGQTNISISGLELIGDTSVNATFPYYGNGIYLVNCSDVLIFDNYVHGFVQGGIAIQDANASLTKRGRIYRNRIDSISSIGGTYVSGIHGIALIDGVQYWDVYENRVTNIGTATNGTGGMGIVCYQLNTGYTTPDAVVIRDNYVYNTCQHGITMYASQLTTAEFHPDSKILGNVVDTTGTATLQGVGGPANQLGNGIYCEMLIPSVVGENSTYNTHVAAISSSIADSAIAVMVNITPAILSADLVISGNSCHLCNRGGIRVQRIKGVNITGNSATSVVTNALRLDGVENFAVSGFTGTSNGSTTDGIAIYEDGLGTYAGGCQQGNFSGINIVGFANGISLLYAQNLSITATLTAYTSIGYALQTCTNCSAILRCSEVTVPAVYSVSSTCSTCHVTLHCPNRSTYTSPYVINAATGVIVETWSNSSAPNQGTWAVGDMVRYRTPSASSPDYARCTVAGTAGTWKTGANLSA